jgi:HAE1 family hydrophobic/amphiphilic exporter-1
MTSVPVALVGVVPVLLLSDTTVNVQSIMELVMLVGIVVNDATTVLGLLALALGWGAGSGLQAPLARVVVGGLLASTFVTLFLIPVLYVGLAECRPALHPAMAARRTPQRT